LAQRYFISRLPLARLRPDHWLLVVRRHWAVETVHQVLDVAFAEDAAPVDPERAVCRRRHRRAAAHRLRPADPCTRAGWMMASHADCVMGVGLA
jgi:hypothetical protein